MKKTESNKSTSWEPVHKWYKTTVSTEGHYYHRQVIIPGVLRLLELNESSSLLDLACGNGVFCSHIPKKVHYEGIDISPSLIKDARKNNPKTLFHVADITKTFPTKKTDFTHSIIILALQNIEHPDKVFQLATKHLASEAKLIIVLNHPSFRIPRQTSWQIDAENKIQYRRIDRYSSPLKIPIQASPSKGARSASTWSFHYPLADYSRWLHEAGFTIDLIEEWHSDKTSTGGAAKMENRSRAEFPLFMTLICRKK